MAKRKILGEILDVDVCLQTKISTWNHNYRVLRITTYQFDNEYLMIKVFS